MGALVQYFFSGLSIGGVYALVAIGFYIMWTTARAVNFAHGETLMMAAVLTIVLHDRGIPVVIAGALALIVCVLFGIVLERYAVRPFLAQAQSVGWMLTTIAVGIMLESYATIAFGSFARPLASPLVEKPIHILGAGLFLQELLVPLAVLAILVLLTLFQRRTQLGRAMRAVAFNPTVASLVGVNVSRIMIFSFALAAGLGGLAGLLAAPVIQASATMGLMLGLKGFAVAIVGGITNVYGVVLAGFAYGVVEKFVDGYVGSAAREAVGFSLVIAILMIWPQGIFGSRDTVKV